MKPIIFLCLLFLACAAQAQMKKDINTEVLLEIVQKKQQEIKHRIFRNQLVRLFNKADENKDLKNFTTYYYLYNVMDILTTGQNKTAMSKALLEQSAEFAYVYGVVRFSYWKVKDTLNIRMESKKETSKNTTKGDLKEPDTSVIKTFNLYLDMGYDILSQDPEFKKFEFKRTLEDLYFKTWYNNDNVYLKEIAKGNHEVKNQRKILKKAIEETLEEIRRGKLVKNFYQDLEKSRFKDFSMTQEQFDAMKFLLDDFLTQSKNHFESNVVNIVLEFLLESVQFPEGEAQKRYPYIEVESLILAIDKKLENLPSKRISIYLEPFFDIGVNYSSFLHNNTLNIDASGKPFSLSDLYFASERIGFRYKIWNWKYTRSFEAGQRFSYYSNSYKTWKRPQKSPLISDIHMLVYGSGILYNLANLKSNDKFNYAIGGAGIGLKFFNGFSVNLSAACPFTHNRFASENVFINLGIDVPIVEYISALRSK